jgi:hypothetical protein
VVAHRVGGIGACFEVGQDSGEEDEDWKRKTCAGRDGGEETVEGGDLTLWVGAGVLI